MRRGTAAIAPVAAGAEALARDVGIGHMYNLVVPVHLPSQADDLLRAAGHTATIEALHDAWAVHQEIVGYADPLSVRAGDLLNVCVSCDVTGITRRRWCV